jgi:hypothetical protein
MPEKKNLSFVGKRINGSKMSRRNKRINTNFKAENYVKLHFLRREILQKGYKG